MNEGIFILIHVEKNEVFYTDYGVPFFKTFFLVHIILLNLMKEVGRSAAPAQHLVIKYDDFVMKHDF